tara:strand:- start:6558 stop:6785 length:228 start_codon:yes stop_codon:yes gene_type:complete
MNLPIYELIDIGNLWIQHLESKDILRKQWEVRVIENDGKIGYKSKHVSKNILIGLLEEHMLTYIHYIYDLKTHTP